MEQLRYFRDTIFKVGEIQLFKNIEKNELIAIKQTLDHCPVVEAKSGEIVLDSQSSGACLYVVLSGVLAQTSVTSKRQLENSSTQYFAGECVGEISVLDEEASTATIAAVTDTQLLLINSSVMWQLIDESNGVARNLLQLLSFRIRATNAQLRNRQKVGEFYRQLSMVDGLTGLHNRSWLNSQLPGMIENAHATNADLSIIMLDLDHFKKFNDQHGHIMGDEALQACAKVISASLRPSDFAARYGGEEMIIILSNTNKESAYIVAERLCERIRSTIVFKDTNLTLPHITASLGLATLLEGQDGLAVIASADAALYRAKERGRDQVAL
ncbi:GGDEF domain-containing protein [Undibacterium fentianense]|uniref:diguanylate cyclase n=1 Tax=Undibacterium fentianense TaxID=2828728 RepID=A0A941IEV4_9BURK|nr:GGDEF domain-containing protein [Undibacterium fentianense]MBR7800026.1 GGDEF domain-containing protein [Undibacterium fentianense]